MIWIKSFAVGVGSALLALPILFISFALMLKSRSPATAIGIDVVAFMRIAAVRLILASIFALAFIWEYRRVRVGS
jgi:hypothetical protein